MKQGRLNLAKQLLLLFLVFGIFALFFLFLPTQIVRAAPSPKPAVATITVNTPADEFDVAPNGTCSLREAIQSANTDTDFGGCTHSGTYGDDTISLPAGTNTITIDAAGDENLNTEGDLDINSNIIINGAGSGSTVINANSSLTGEKAFHVTGAFAFNISGVTIKNGFSDGGSIYNNGGTVTVSSSTLGPTNGCGGGGAAIINWLAGGIVTVMNSLLSNNCAGGGGGAIYNNSGTAMTIMSSTISFNTAPGNGGAIYNKGTMTITNSSILSNTSGLAGGGIANLSGGNLTLLNSTVTNNKSTTGEGGGIYHTGTALFIDTSTISNNQSGDNGGGIRTIAPMTLMNSTVYSNTAQLGAGIYAAGDAILINDTISQNMTSAGDGGGIELVSDTMAITNTTIISNTACCGGGGGGINTAGGTFTLKNTLIANNFGGNCGGSAFTSNGNNLSSDGFCSASFVAGSDQNNVTNPRVGPLANNGGPTLTHALLVGSPAINAGTNSGCPSTDQRGVARPQGTLCDIGAYEAPLFLFLPLIVR